MAFNQAPRPRSSSPRSVKSRAERSIGERLNSVQQARKPSKGIASSVSVWALQPVDQLWTGGLFASEAGAPA